MIYSRRIFTLIGLILCSCIMKGQINEKPLSFFEPSDSIFNKKRFVVGSVSAGVIYTGFSIALYNTWYKQYDRTTFHFFNDWNEWENMDKYGHLYTAYFQSSLVYKGAKWAGLKERERIIWGVALGSLFQTTIEVMDGFSTEWGFSIPDFTANLFGVGAFALQQKYWGEQKIMFKVSNSLSSYPDSQIAPETGMETISLQERADDLFGTSMQERYLKDYNLQTIWMSANIRSFFPRKQLIPSWLNVSIGYGAENMYGGFDNSFTYNGSSFDLNDSHPRYKQYYLSLDVDLTRIKTKSPFLKTLLTVLNIFKIPAPALEYNSLGELEWHWLFF